MKTIGTLFILLYGLIAQMPQGFICTKSIEKNGMTIEWTFHSDYAYFEISAPTNGWLAIGFNKKNQLVGNNLIMANIRNDVLTCSDRYIVGIGDHRAVENLGGVNHLSEISAESSNQKSTVRFHISKKALDKYHCNLKKGEEIYLLLAYSMEDDFEHHSRMRTSIKIIL